MKLNKKELLKFVGYPTIKKFFELEKSELTDFVENGVKYIIKNTLNLKVNDSNGETFSKRDNNETVVKIYSSFEYVKDKKPAEIIDLGEFIKLKLLEKRLNVSSSKILYVEINKKLL